MLARLQIRILVAFLLIVGLSAAAYKHVALGFPLLANTQQVIWKIEAKINKVSNAAKNIIPIEIGV